MSWRLAWSLWIGIQLALAAVSFAILETLSWNNGTTLSRFIWDLSRDWPLLIFIIGHLSGGLTWGLAVHFWWHWSPPGSVSKG